MMRCRADIRFSAPMQLMCCSSIVGQLFHHMLYIFSYQSLHIVLQQVKRLDDKSVINEPVGRVYRCQRGHLRSFKVRAEGGASPYLIENPLIEDYEQLRMCGATSCVRAAERRAALSVRCRQAALAWRWSDVLTQRWRHLRPGSRSSNSCSPAPHCPVRRKRASKRHLDGGPMQIASGMASR